MNYTDLLYLFDAASKTMMMAIIAIVMSTFVGVIGGVASVLGGRLVEMLVLAAVYILRGIPILVQLFLVYFGLPFFGFRVSPYTVAIIAISLHMGALVVEVVRGALVALPKQQSESGLALGMTPLMLMIEVLAPQALRAALPPYVSLIPITIKATSLASVISIWELTLASKEIANQTLATFEVFGAAFAIYFVICFPFTWFGRRLEQRYTGYWQ
ncbi:MAG TPA: amino acid ABC transporter permease [Alphaproteobacteria bacterium]|jgi:His/Glu/Gln/Arg/opine family amino acid ABC transporter permease subunit|nr:amino acid ABC transporter permease [Alphaproteobacteria bacterium]